MFFGGHVRGHRANGALDLTSLGGWGDAGLWDLSWGGEGGYVKAKAEVDKKGRKAKDCGWQGGCGVTGVRVREDSVKRGVLETETVWGGRRGYSY